MYCIKCGVELADSEKVCPLCGTRVFHPDLPQSEGEAPFPPDPRGKTEEFNRAGWLFILTLLALHESGVLHAPCSVLRQFTLPSFFTVPSQKPIVVMVQTRL